MLSVVIICVIAGGTCYAQSPGPYSDCDGQQSIIDRCGDTHLAYLTQLQAGDQAKTMQRVSEIDDPSFLLEHVQLGVICNQTGHLEEYYQCVYANLTSCLQDANSTQARNLPEAGTISTGISNVCHNRNKLNETCLQVKAKDVETCFSTFIGESEKAGDQCATYEELIRCTDKQSVCPGGKVIKDFVISARPNACAGTGTGAVPAPPPPLAVVLLIWAAVLLGRLDP